MALSRLLDFSESYINIGASILCDWCEVMVMGDDVPGIIRIYFNGRVSSSFSFRSPESSWSHPHPHILPWHLVLRYWVSTDLPVFFCHDCYEQGRSGWVHLANPGPLQKSQRRKFEKNSQKVWSRQEILLEYWMELPEMLHRESGHCLGNYCRTPGP